MLYASCILCCVCVRDVACGLYLVLCVCCVVCVLCCVRVVCVCYVMCCVVLCVCCVCVVCVYSAIFYVCYVDFPNSCHPSIHLHVTQALSDDIIPL